MSTRVMIVPDDDGNIPSFNMGSASANMPANIVNSLIKINPVTLQAGAGIRDLTSNNWGSGPTDWSSWGRQVWRVDNTHNQPIDIFLNFVNTGDYTKFDGTPMKITVPANKTNLLITPADFPILGEAIADPITTNCKGSGATAPTAGTIVIVSYPQPII